MFEVALVAFLLGAAQNVVAQTPRPRLVLICAPCHGFDGIGRDRTIPNLAGQGREYLQTQMLAFRNDQRRHPTMNFFSGQVNMDEVNQLLDFYAALPRQ
jgi:cytochrome c553